MGDCIELQRYLHLNIQDNKKKTGKLHLSLLYRCPPEQVLSFILLF